MGILSKGITKYYEIGKTIGKWVEVILFISFSFMKRWGPCLQVYLLGRGSFATVKEGVRKDTGQKVAIKVIDKKDAVFDAESLEQEVSFFAIIRARITASKFYLHRLRRWKKSIIRIVLLCTEFLMKAARHTWFSTCKLFGHLLIPVESWHCRRRITGGTVMDRIIANDHFSEKVQV